MRKAATMPMRWYQIKIVRTCEHDDGYDQALTMWVKAYGRINAVAKAMIDAPLISDAELKSVEVLATQDAKPSDWAIVRDKDRGDFEM